MLKTRKCPKMWLKRQTITQKVKNLISKILNRDSSVKFLKIKFQSSFPALILHITIIVDFTKHSEQVILSNQ